MIDVLSYMEYFHLEIFDGFEQAHKVEGEPLLELTAAPSRPRGIQSIALYRGSREHRGCRGSRERRGCRQAWMLGPRGNQVCPKQTQGKRERRDTQGGSQPKSRPLAFDAGDGADGQLLVLALEGERVSGSRERRSIESLIHDLGYILATFNVQLEIILSEE